MLTLEGAAPLEWFCPILPYGGIRVKLTSTRIRRPVLTLLTILRIILTNPIPVFDQIQTWLS